MTQQRTIKNRLLRSSLSVVCAGLIGALSVAGITFGSAEASADELPFAMTYRAPASCPTASVLREVVTRLVTTDDPNPFAARVEIEAHGDSYVGRILASDGGARELTAHTCVEVIEAIAVVMALAISPGNPAIEPASLPPTTVVEAPIAQPVASVVPPPFARLTVGGGATFDSGSLPQTAAGLAARVGLRARTWAAAVDGTYWFKQRGLLPGDTTRGGTIAWQSARASGCALLLKAPELSVCAGPELGRLRGEGFGIALPRQATAFWLTAQAWVELGGELSEHWRVRAELGESTPLIGRHPFVLDGIGTIYEPAMVSARGLLGADYVF